MNIHLMENREGRGWTTFGGYWPRGSVYGDGFALRNEAGEPVAVQSEIAARWGDGSIKWSRHTVRAEALGTGGEILGVKAAGTEREAGPDETTVREGPKACPDEMTVREGPEGWVLCSGRMRLTIPRKGDALAEHWVLEGREGFSRVTPALRICHEREEGDTLYRETVRCSAVIRDRTIETAGPLETVIRFDGAHMDGGKEKMPFRIRMYVHPDGEMSFEDTFFFQGDPEADRLAGWGLEFETRLRGTSYQRQIRFLTDGDVFRDNGTQLFYWRKHLDPALLAAQQRGETVEETAELDEIAADLPRWDHFRLIQDSAEHYAISKKAWEKGCWLEGMQGRRAPGSMCVSDPEGRLSLHIRDFWEKHPGGLETEGLSGETTRCTAWFYAPGTEPYDFRHYDRRTYPQGNYEGFDYMRPDPNGIAVTCGVTVTAGKGILTDEGLKAENRQVRKPPVYLGDPAYYHEHRAFGYWSLPERETETGRWAEEQIQAACDFYREEREARSWYGLFNYGDFMHTYEASRHMWRWDVGGYAWDNTELVPTYWLWLQFMRTGSEEVFRMAEALSRHTADTDMYHFGSMKGLGSRHNVRHWGCPCKEPRVSMAGHHRPLYYLTGSRRIGDCMEDALAAGDSLAAMPWYAREDGTIRLRSGPDWAALVSDWMTAYERTLDPKWKKMIETGIEDLKKAPMGLTSGPVFGFDPESGHLTYEGEAKPGQSMHLQACMGGTEVWLEAAEMLDRQDLAEMTAENGRYFYLPEAERLEASGGLLAGRQFGSPIYSAEMQAWAARAAGDREMGRRIRVSLMGLLYAKDRKEGFRKKEVYARRENGEAMWEIPWVSTNFTAQWCLKMIVVSELIPGVGPESLEELERELEERPSAYKLYGA